MLGLHISATVPGSLIRPSGTKSGCRSEDPEETLIVMDAPGQGPRKEARVSLWLHEFEMAWDSLWMGCSHSGGHEFEGGVVCMVAHPDQMRRGQRSQTAERECRAYGKQEAAMGSPEGSVKTQMMELHVAHLQLLTQWV